MFYSQFILAKKGPLGTIWIAAHLERKLRKNQVADTDIGVSVDSILFPDVPIALRLSSHLLLGVVRIYSRKVNYLFDDCSEALLKVKQAFRSTAVDLPPEESTAPYHSITLPETFDLDDFELPDSENFNGSYDHHVSTREQITLQDSMEGVNYSTTQFGLDERFGDGDTSGLDLDEELFLSKVTAPGQAEVVQASNPDHESTQPLTPFELGKDVEDAHEDTETADLGGYDDPMDYAHAPSTPGLVEEPNFAKVQGAVCDDHLDLADDPNLINIQDSAAGNDPMELEDHNLCAVKENMGSIAQNSDLHHGMPNAVNPSLPTATNSVSVFGEQEIELKSVEIRTSDAANELHSAEEGVFSNNGPVTFSVDGTKADRGETREVGLDDIVSYPPSSHEATLLEDLFGNTSSVTENMSNKSGFEHVPEGLSDSYQDAQRPEVSNGDRGETREVGLDDIVSYPPSSHEATLLEDIFGHTSSVTENMSNKSGFEHVPEGLSDSYQDAHRPEVSNNIEDARGEQLSHPASSVLAPDFDVSGGVEFEDPETQASKEPNDSRTLNAVVPKELAVGDMHILRPCNHLDQPSSVNNGYDVSGSHQLPSGVNGPCGMDTSELKEVLEAPEASTVVQGEGYPATYFLAPVTEDYQTTEPAAREDIRVDSMLSRDTLSKNIDPSETSQLPAVEKLLSLPEGFADPQNNILEFTPANMQLGTANGGDAIDITSGRKRSFAESNLTVQSIDSIDSFEVIRSKRAKGFVPDDDDLLSSILVGRRSSVLKVKATPPVQEKVRMKRPRSTPRPSASKRKIIMDDAMVLHGDVIRQQLTNTEDIRRTRKKAPCTRSEIWMIQREMLEDEIFSEPIITGLSAGLALLHKSYDLSQIRLSQDETQKSVVDAAPEDENVPRKETIDFELSAEPNVDKEIATDGLFESNVVGNDLVAECIDNQEAVDHILESTVNDCTQLQVTVTTDVPQPQSLTHEHPALVAEIDCGDQATELNPPTGPVAESALATDVFSGDGSVMAASFIDPPALSNQETNVESSFHIEASGLPSDQNLDPLFVETEITGDYRSSEHKDSDAVKVTEENEDLSAVGVTVSTGREESPLKEVEEGASFDFGEEMQTVCNPHITDTHPSVAVCADESDRPVDHVDMTLEESLQDMFKDELPTKEVEFLATELDYAGKVPTSYGSTEEPNLSVVHPEELGAYPEHASINEPNLSVVHPEELGAYPEHASINEPNLSVVHPEELGAYPEHASINVGESPSAWEADPQNTIDAENLDSGHADLEDNSELGYTLDGHDTGFLNDDDDDIAEEGECYVPSPDRTSDDYSGWSTRTRAVAKYLQVLFDKEPDHGKKTLPMDNLLVGKTRKEASRMFFEALVLKTRDYVHVEQANPFDKISIKPGVKMTTKFDF